jgi:GAF domain-containing protein
VREYIPHDFTALATFDEEIGQLRVHAVEVSKREAIVADGTPLPMKGTFAGVAYTTRKTVLRDRIDFDEFNAPLLRPAVEELGLKSLCVVPLIQRDRIVGTVSLASRCGVTR